jgi:hypothetical protein
VRMLAEDSTHITLTHRYVEHPDGHIACVGSIDAYSQSMDSNLVQMVNLHHRKALLTTRSVESEFFRDPVHVPNCNRPYYPYGYVQTLPAPIGG